MHRTVVGVLDKGVSQGGDEDRESPCTNEPGPILQECLSGEMSEANRQVVERQSHRPSNRRLTVKLRGRAEAPDGAEGAQFLSARGDSPEAPHGPLQRLLDCTRASRDLARRRAMSVPEKDSANTTNPAKKVPWSVFAKAPARSDGTPRLSSTIVDGIRAPYESQPNQTDRVRSKNPPYAAAGSETASPPRCGNAKETWLSESCASKSPNTATPTAPTAPRALPMRAVRSAASFTGAI